MPASEQSSSPTDRSLVTQAQAGDLAAFDELVSRYQSRLFNLAYRMTSDYQAAEDITQEAFLKAYRTIEGFRGDAAFSTWIYRIARNTAVDFLRRSSKHRHFSLDEPFDTGEGEMEHQVVDEKPGPQAVAVSNEVSDLVQEALTEVPVIYREAVILRDIDDLAYEEIADVLSLSKGTVKSRIYRGRQYLRDVLLEQHPELFGAGSVQSRKGGESSGA